MNNYMLIIYTETKTILKLLEYSMFCVADSVFANFPGVMQSITDISEIFRIVFFMSCNLLKATYDKFTSM